MSVCSGIVRVVVYQVPRHLSVVVCVRAAVLTPRYAFIRIRRRDLSRSVRFLAALLRFDGAFPTIFSAAIFRPGFVNFRF